MRNEAGWKLKDIKVILTYKREEVETVICKSDGEIKYCNALGVDGTCAVRDCACSLAVAVIVKHKNSVRQYLAIEH